MSGQCRWLHDWGAWGEPIWEPKERHYQNQKIPISVEQQYRQCARCGQVEVRRIQ